LQLCKGNVIRTNPTYNECENGDGKEVRKMLSAIHEHGQGLVEYALILVLVTLVVVVVLLVLGPVIGNVFTRLNSSLVNP
jgi:pilus assembly protein Flp/PilA